MENNQIWLKPKPTHIDEYFEGFLSYLSSGKATDMLYIESVHLLKQRVSILVQERMDTPLYRQNKDPEVLKFNARLCGAWLLAVNDAGKQERKLVMLTMINNLVHIALKNKVPGLNNNNLAIYGVASLLDKAMRLAVYDMPCTFTFSWDDLTHFFPDLFAVKTLSMALGPASQGWYDGRGLMMTKDGKILLANYTKQQFDMSYFRKTTSVTQLLPDYGIAVSTDQPLQIKESKKDDIQAIETFVDDILHLMKNGKKENQKKRLRDYSDGEYVPVEVTEVSAKRIMLRTIDPEYNIISGQLVFEQNLKIFSKIYPVEVWAKVLKVGERFNANVNTSNNSFSITNLFVDYIYDNARPEDTFDTHNHMVAGSWLKLREFWTDQGFMVYVDITEEDNEKLQETDGYAGVEISHVGTGQFRGCVYGHICDFEVEKRDISRDEVCPAMLRSFIQEHSEVKLSERNDSFEPISTEFIKEYCKTLNILQSREVNPLVRYRILSVMRLMCTLLKNDKEGDYCHYIAKYIKTLVVFAKADSNEGELVAPITVPEDLKDEETVMNGADILKILSCFAKNYDATTAVLNPYIDRENEVQSNTASLVLSYNRLYGLLEVKTLKGIKKQILNLLSVVTDGDSTLELSNEFEGIFGEEDDMKEFKTSFFEAPANANEQRQPYNIFRGICAMMNNRGGVLYLGVNDRGIPVGLKNDLQTLSSRYNKAATLDAYMLHISKMGEEWFGERFWKYVTLKPIPELLVVSIIIEPYPYDMVFLKDKTTYLRKNNASAPVTDQETIEDIRRRRLKNIRKTDDKIIIVQDAIQREKRVRLIGYRSSNSGTIRNRLVEAFYIQDNEYIHCYEPESDMVKLFRISRADKIDIIDDAWKFKDRHKRINMDPFHMSGETKTNIKLHLKLSAKNAIEESYPGISSYIKQYDSDTWSLETFTYDLNPLMFFYISNAKDVEIVEAEGLKEAVQEYVKEFLNPSAD